LLEKCFSERLGGALRVSLLLSNETVKQAGDVKDPAIRSAIDLFKGRVL
jgi:hypothetical protein